LRPAVNLRTRIAGWINRRGSNNPTYSADGSALVDTEFLRKLDRLSLALGNDLITGLMGEHLAQRRTAGIEFADYRAYSPGDDIRRVDWNAYARLGTLHVRQSQAEHDTTLYLLVDASPSMDFGLPTKFFAARRLAAALGYIALSHLDTLVLSAPGQVLRTTDDGRRTTDDAQHPALESSVLRGRAEAGSLFRFLQEMRMGRQVQFDDLLKDWGTRRGQGRIAVIISDLLLDGYREGVRRLTGAGFQVTLLQVLSAEELRPPEVGDLELVDSETNGLLEIHLGDESMAEYKRRLSAWLTDTSAWCASQGAGHVLIESHWDIERVLLETLRRQGVTQ
jgi:uncharacterized protein (DUF58 family)